MRHNLWDRMMYRLLQEKKEQEIKAAKKKGSKPDFLDLDDDGDKTEPMSKASKEAGDKKASPKAKKGKGKIPPQLRMHIKKKQDKKNKLDEAIERLEKILIQEKYKHPWDLEDAEPTEDDFTGRFSDEPEEDEEYHHHKHKKHKDNFDLENPDKNLFEMGQEDLYEYGEEKEPDPAEQDLDDNYDDDDDYIERHEDDWDDDFSDWDGGEPEGDEDDSDLEGDSEICPKCNKPEEECECWDDEEDYEYEHDHSEEVDEPEDEDYKDELEEVQYLSESEVKKKKPRLGKVTRNPAGSNKKFHVYVKCNGRVKKISFGDPGLSIKRDSAARRKNFRARHKCDKPAGKNRCTARYWSCYQWRAGKKVEGE